MKNCSTQILSTYQIDGVQVLHSEVHLLLLGTDVVPDSIWQGAVVPAQLPQQMQAFVTADNGFKHPAGKKNSCNEKTTNW